MRIKQITTIALAIIFAIGIAGSAFAKDSVKLIDSSKAIKGKNAPRFSLETIEGETFMLEDYLGKKPVVITFWATWCPPCVKELPYLQDFYEKYEDTVEVIGISINSAKEKKVVQNKIKELKITFDIGIDAKRKILKLYSGNKLVPYLVVIDKAGKAKLLQFGAPHPENMVKELEEILGDDLKATPATTTSTTAAGEETETETETESE